MKNITRCAQLLIVVLILVFHHPLKAMTLEELSDQDRAEVAITDGSLICSGGPQPGITKQRCIALADEATRAGISGTGTETEIRLAWLAPGACSTCNQLSPEDERRVAEARRVRGERLQTAASGLNPQGSGRYSNAGANGAATGPVGAQGCFPADNIDCSRVTICTEGNTDCQETNGVKHYKDMSQMSVDFEDYPSCSGFLITGSSSSGSSDEIAAYTQITSNPTRLKSRICRLVASSCPVPQVPSGAGRDDIPRIQRAYDACIYKVVTGAEPPPAPAPVPPASAASSGNGGRLRAVIVGVQKCIAVGDAITQTTDFERGAAASSLDGRVNCKRHPGDALDYPACSSFIAWYNSLVAAQTGVQLYNEGDKVTTGMRAQNRLAAESQNGNVQALGVEAARSSTMAAANAEERNKIFFAAKGAAITAQLVSFTTPENIGGKCESQCCSLFAGEGQDSIQSTDRYFPNQGMKAAMIAEVIRAGGEAALAAMKQAELERQAAAMRAAEEQILAAGDESEEGIMRFCQQYPLDAKCLSAGNRVPLSGTAFNGPGFSGQNFGLGTLDQAADANVNTESGSELGAAPSAGDAVAAIGDMNKEAAAAKNEFDKPSALRGGGGTPTFSPQTGAGASASANGLSRDPGVEGEKKENPLKITSKNVNYDGGGATYDGGGWRPGSEKKEDAAANPFASMFGKDKGRDPAAAKEIDAPASDLFTKISNRYQEVQKRKALMDVR